MSDSVGFLGHSQVGDENTKNLNEQRNLSLSLSLSLCIYICIYIYRERESLHRKITQQIHRWEIHESFRELGVPPVSGDKRRPLPLVPG